MISALLIRQTSASIAMAMMLIGLSIGDVILGEGTKAAAPDTPAAVPEYALKAAFLYNFALFTTWPDRYEKLLHLCVLGRDPFGTALDSLVGKDANGARITVSRLRNLNEAVRSCQIIFVTDADVDAFVAQTAGASPVKGVLTIAEREGAARAGIMIELISENGKISFEFNQMNADKSGVTVSSKLLRLARKIY